MSDTKNDDGNLVGGVILVVVGLLALIVTLFDVDVVWEELARLWPVLIIIFGVSLLPLNKLVKSILIVLVILISCLIYCNEVNGNENEFSSLSQDVYHNGNVKVQEFSEPYQNRIKEASVEINYGAGTLFLNSPVDELVKARNTSDCITQDFSVVYEGESADIVFDVKNRNANMNDVDVNHFEFSLNDKPVYDFEVNVGACDMNLDFSEYKVEDIEINGGACSINVRLGELYNSTDLSIDAGVADIVVAIPNASGCRIECESVFSAKDFDGFDKKSTGVYVTSNYSSARNVINIEFEGAMSDLEIVRY